MRALLFWTPMVMSSNKIIPVGSRVFWKVSDCHLAGTVVHYNSLNELQYMVNWDDGVPGVHSLESLALLLDPNDLLKEIL